VSENPRLDLAAFDATATFIRRGVVPVPWSLAADGVVTARAVNLSAQDDAGKFKWNGTGAMAVIGPPVDLTKQAAAGADLLLDWRIGQRGNTPVRLTMGGATLDFSSVVQSRPQATAGETRIPLACFAKAGANFAAVGGPLRIEAGPGFGLTIRTARVAEGKPGTTCPAGN
jgi:beta-glucosidase